MAQIKKKKFFDVEIPLLNKETQLSAYEINELENRYINYDLTRMLRGKNVDMQFKVKMENGKPKAYPIKMMILPYFIRRVMRKGTDYVEDSFSTKCKNAAIRIKPFLITRRKVSRAVRKALRNKAKEEFIEHIKNKKYEDILDDLLKGQLQRALSLKLKKIYPLSFCDIRMIKVEKE